MVDQEQDTFSITINLPSDEEEGTMSTLLPSNTKNAKKRNSKKLSRARRSHNNNGSNISELIRKDDVGKNIKSMFKRDDSFWTNYFTEMLSPSNRYPLPPQAPAFTNMTNNSVLSPKTHYTSGDASNSGGRGSHGSSHSNNSSHRRGNSSGNFKFKIDSSSSGRSGSGGGSPASGGRAAAGGGKSHFVYSQEYDSDPLIQAHPILLPQVEEDKKILEFALLNDLDYNLNRKESETKFYETQQQTMDQFNHISSFLPTSNFNPVNHVQQLSLVSAGGGGNNSSSAMDQYYASNNMVNPLKPKIVQLGSVDSTKTTLIKHMTSNNSLNTLNTLSPTFTDDTPGIDHEHEHQDHHEHSGHNGHNGHNEQHYSSNDYTNGGINLTRADSDASDTVITMTTENTYASTHVASTIATRGTHETRGITPGLNSPTETLPHLRNSSNNNGNNNNSNNSARRMGSNGIPGYNPSVSNPPDFLRRETKPASSYSALDWDNVLINAGAPKNRGKKSSGGSSGGTGGGNGREDSPQHAMYLDQNGLHYHYREHSEIFGIDDSNQNDFFEGWLMTSPLKQDQKPMIPIIDDSTTDGANYINFAFDDEDPERKQQGINENDKENIDRNNGNKTKREDKGERKIGRIETTPSSHSEQTKTNSKDESNRTTKELAMSPTSMITVTDTETDSNIQSYALALSLNNLIQL